MIQKNLKIENKLVFVVGGNGLLGNEISTLLVKNGARVVILDLKISKDLKNKIIFEKFDLAQIHKIKNRLQNLCNKYGCPDIFVNVAYPRTKSWKKCNYNELNVYNLEKNISIHLNSSIWSATNIARIMKAKKKNGSIIIVNSIYGIVGQDKNLYKGNDIQINPVYSSIKGGLLSFVKNLSSYYGDANIRVNSIICGGIQGHIAGTAQQQKKDFVKKFASKTLLKRMGLPKDIAPTVVFLASEDSSYITGSEIIVDGGYTSF